MARTDELKARVLEEVDALGPLAKEIAVYLYEHPETGLDEVLAAEMLTETLAEAGFRVERGLAGMPTSFRATIGGSGPSIAFMAEYDALPSIGHGCGHNLIAAAAVVCGIALSRVFRDAGEEGPRFVVLGTPAEETVGGKVAMVEAGVFAGIDAALIAHPGQTNQVGGGVRWASHPLEITFTGKPSHAGGSPEKGINALDACVAAYTSIRNLRNHLRDSVRIAGIITKGGDAQNVVPDRAQLRFTLRSTDWRYLEETVIPKVKDCAKGAALSFGASVEFRHHEPLFRDTLDYPMLMDLAKRSFEHLGEEVVPDSGSGGGGVTDVGNVTWVTPGIQIGYRATTARGHSKEMADATVTPEGLSALLMATKALSLMAVDLVRDRRILDDSRDYLHRRLKDFA